mmetsp:Transcript_24804/g.57560  ORF Transcript_24804/g.57560 Transcript_24804/m.57560 type:complete len:196 (+) Transcript_24804:117-704(+)
MMGCFAELLQGLSVLIGATPCQPVLEDELTRKRDQRFLFKVETIPTSPRVYEEDMNLQMPPFEPEAPCSNLSMEELWKEQRLSLGAGLFPVKMQEESADFQMTVETEILASDTIGDGVNHERGLACSMVRGANEFFESDAIRMTLFLEGKRSCTTYIQDEVERRCQRLVAALLQPHISDDFRRQLSERLARIRGV